MWTFCAIIFPQNLPFFTPHASMSPVWSASVVYYDPGMVRPVNFTNSVMPFGKQDIGGFHLLTYLTVLRAKRGNQGNGGCKVMAQISCKVKDEL